MDSRDQFANGADDDDCDDHCNDHDDHDDRNETKQKARRATMDLQLLAGFANFRTLFT